MFCSFFASPEEAKPEANRIQPPDSLNGCGLSIFAKINTQIGKYPEQPALAG